MPNVKSPEPPQYPGMDPWRQKQADVEWHWARETIATAERTGDWSLVKASLRSYRDAIQKSRIVATAHGTSDGLSDYHRHWLTGERLLSNALRRRDGLPPTDECMT